MTVAEFVDNLADLNDGENFSRDILHNIYQSIRDDPIEFELLVYHFVKRLSSVSVVNFDIVGLHHPSPQARLTRMFIG